MTEFELRSSGIGSDRAVSCDSSTAHKIILQILGVAKLSKFQVSSTLIATSFLCVARD